MLIFIHFKCIKLLNLLYFCGLLCYNLVTKLKLEVCLWQIKKQLEKN